MEKRLCQSLLKQKITNPDTYELLTKLLSFIYKDVKQECFNEQKHRLCDEIVSKKMLDTERKTSNDPDVLDKMHQELFDLFVESSDGIIEKVIELSEYDKNQNDVQTFLNKILFPIELFEKGIIYTKTEIYLYIYNLYTLLSAFSYNKEDMPKLFSIIDDIVFTFINDKEVEETYDWIECGSLRHYKKIWAPAKQLAIKKEMISSILKNKNYQNFEHLPKLLNVLLQEMQQPYKESKLYNYQKIIEIYENLSNDIDELKKLDINPNNATIMEIQKDTNSLLYKENNIFYCSALLIGDRYNYFKASLNAIESNPIFQKEIFDYVKQIDYQIFNYLNQDSKEDSFITYLNYIFDSDTYQELIKRLETLVEASNLFKKVSKEAGLEKIKEVNSDAHIEKINGCNLKWPVNSSNMKSQKMIDRMKVLYQKHIVSSQFDDLTKKYFQGEYNQISELCDDLKKANKPVEEIKVPTKFQLQEIAKAQKYKKSFFFRT